MREIINKIFDRAFSEDDLSKFTEPPNAQKVFNTVSSSGDMNTLGQGEPIIDIENNRTLVKIDGILYKQVKDANSDNIILQEV